MECECSRCGEETPDLRTIRISCGADMNQLGIPFQSETVELYGCVPPPKEIRNTLRVCKKCRAEFMMTLQAWFKKRKRQ